jgi:hypothetical protein
MKEDSTTDPEKRILERASKTVECPRLQDLTADVLQQFTEQHGIDFATALLFDRISSSADHRPAITRLDELRRGSGSADHIAPPNATFAVVPGAFYEEFPHTGADGRILCDQAAKAGYRTATIPVSSTGTLSGNAAVICDWLASQPNEKIILASVSKGGSDIKYALSLENAAHAFRNVVAWINVCGILDGSPMVNWVLSRRMRTMFFQSVFWLRGYDFSVIRDLRWGAGSPLDFELRLPDHMKMINVVGFPLTGHMTNRLSRTFRSRIASRGPNDGSVMLADACKLPGVIYPVWGADHYMRPSWALRTLAFALLQYIAEDLSLVETSERSPIKYACE